MSNKEEKSKRRKQPFKKVHRKMLDMTLTEGMKEMLIEHIVMLEKYVIRSKNDMMEYLHKNVIDAIITAANEKLPPELQQDSLVLHSTDGSLKISINQQIRRWFDDRAHQATSYVMDFIDEHRQISVDSDMEVMLDWLQGMFFGASRKKKFKFTPQLFDFMNKEPDELKDDRLKKAQQILKEAFHHERSKWYYTVEVFDEELNEYVKMERYIKREDQKAA